MQVWPVSRVGMVTSAFISVSEEDKLAPVSQLHSAVSVSLPGVGFFISVCMIGKNDINRC